MIAPVLAIGFVLVQIINRQRDRPSLAVALDSVKASARFLVKTRTDDFGFEGDLGHADLTQSSGHARWNSSLAANHASRNAI